MAAYVKKKGEELAKANGDEALHKGPKKQDARFFGDAPAVKLEPLMKPRGGDLREMVLPGGGDLCLRVWAGVRRYMVALTGWHAQGATETQRLSFTLS